MNVKELKILLEDMNENAEVCIPSRNKQNGYIVEVAIQCEEEYGLPYSHDEVEILDTDDDRYPTDEIRIEDKNGIRNYVVIE